ncbi:ThiF family adenylyltransferase [Geodermatophilus sp. URMC 60]
MSQPDQDGVAQIDRRAAAGESLHLAAAEAREEMADALAREGFRRCDDAVDSGEGWCGVLTFRPVGGEDGSVRMTAVGIAVPDAFPFAPPKVHPGSQAWAEMVTGRTFGEDYYEPGRGWHRDLDLAMCLFDEADHARLRWADGAVLLEQARAWLAADAAGWPDDAPALDLERYLYPAVDQRVVLYGPLHDRDGEVLRLQGKRHGVLRLGRPASQVRSGSRRRRHRWGGDAVLILAAGELAGPIRHWDDLRAAVGADRAQRLTLAQQDGLTRVLMTYTRRGLPAALALELSAHPDGEVQLRAMRAAPDDLATRQIRAGLGAEQLGTRKVAIVGVGAIGSVVADLLHRGGVGHLHLIDADRVLPGNTTRHLLGDAAVGRPKAAAVAEALHATRPHLGQVTFTVDEVDTPLRAIEVLAAFDAVVDATADSTATALLTAAARAGAGHLLSVYVLADGYAVRVDRTPEPDGQITLPAPHLPPPAPTVYEAGCGSPVSTTPPAAAWEAAAIVARHTVALLLNPESVPAGEERRLHPEAVQR